ncbi:MAG: DUF3810 domain-containing protein [Clostridia bacterium]|nr:DUF3810 domain-containing protein [Clostridia bacterium]
MNNKRFTKQMVISFALLALAIGFAYSIRFEIVARMVRPLSVFLTSGLNCITSIVPFSLMQIAVPAFFIGITAYVVGCLIKKRWTEWIPKVALSIAYLIFGYTFFYSYGFSLPYAVNNLPYAVEKHSAKDLIIMTALLVQDMNEANQHIERNENGEVIFDDFRTNAEKVNEGYKKLMEKYDFTDSWYLGKAKQAGILAEPLAYFNINGIFFPYLAEANVGSTSITNEPFIIAHEQAHILGIVRENEANFFAFLACLESGDPQFIYSAYLAAHIYANNAVYSESPEIGGKLQEMLHPDIMEDIHRHNADVRKYDTPAKDVGDKVNDTMLKANGQADGIKTYGYMTDLLISYYKTER